MTISEETENNNELAQFLHSIANDIEAGEASPLQLNHIRDFKRDYSAGVIVANSEAEDMIKFLVLGWYIYTIVLSNRDGQEQQTQS